MTAQDILKELQAMGSASYKKLLMQNYGVTEPLFGVKIGDMKTIQKRIKRDYKLALELYDTGNYDAMYLAGLIADDARMTKEDLQRWVKTAHSGALPGSTVAWVAAGSPHGWELALQWLKSPENHIAEAGWCTLTSLVALKADAELDLPKLKDLALQVQKTIHQAPPGVRYAMNGFIIALGCYVAPLTEFTLQVAEKMGHVTADFATNECQVPFAPDYIRKVQKRDAIGKKRKSVKC